MLPSSSSETSTNSSPAGARLQHTRADRQAQSHSRALTTPGPLGQILRDPRRDHVERKSRRAPRRAGHRSSHHRRPRRRAPSARRAGTIAAAAPAPAPQPTIAIEGTTLRRRGDRRRGSTRPTAPRATATVEHGPPGHNRRPDTRAPHPRARARAPREFRSTARHTRSPTKCTRVERPHGRTVHQSGEDRDTRNTDEPRKHELKSNNGNHAQAGDNIDADTKQI